MKWWQASWAVVLAGCLSDPQPLDCSSPGADPAACGDMGPTIDGGAEPDVDVDGAPTDRGPASGADALPDAAMPRDAAPDGGPIDASPDADPGDPCSAAPCPASPLGDTCVDDRVISSDGPRCTPAVCPDDAVDCDPAVHQCRAFVGCLVHCLLVEPREDCEGTCLADTIEPMSEAANRFGALEECISNAECPDGPLGDACQRKACGAELTGCVGDIGSLWFIRQPAPEQRPYRCDYPILQTDDCEARGELCEAGACVGGDPCEPDPCEPPGPPRCEGATIVTEEPATCRSGEEGPICESVSRIEPCPEGGPASCVGNVAVNPGPPRCIDDGDGPVCDAAEVRSPCGEALPAYCDGNDAIVPRPSACAIEGADARCAYQEDRVPCRGTLCSRGECVDSVCPARCELRSIVGCDPAGGEIRIRCDRDLRCSEGACAPLPAAYGALCRSAEDRATCELAGLTCRGRMIVPQCLFGAGPAADQAECWTTDDCEPGLLCTTFGGCSTGERGRPCLDAADCQGECQRGRCR